MTFHYSLNTNVFQLLICYGICTSLHIQLSVLNIVFDRSWEMYLPLQLHYIRAISSRAHMSSWCGA
jgi:hypothetical protein